MASAALAPEEDEPFNGAGATCPSCKLPSDNASNRHREVVSCSFCGWDASAPSSAVSRYRSSRSSSRRGLPSVNGSNDNGVPSAVNSLLVSSLGSLTLGSLGIGNGGSGGGEKLPHVAPDTRNKLVLHGSGNITEKNKARSAHKKKIKNYPKPLVTTREEFKELFHRAKRTKDFESLHEFYVTTFKTPMALCATFKKHPHQEGATLESADLKSDLLYAALDAIKQLNVALQKNIVRSIVSCLLEDTAQLLDKDYPRCLYILLQNPLFASQPTYTILAHLLQQVTRLPNQDHQLLVHWFRSCRVEKIQSMIQVLLQFVTIRQFPPADRSLPPLSKSRWWIPTATKVLALINAANNLKSQPMIDYTEFYNISLDHMDLMHEYYTWQNPQKANHFSYCQYPFILSIVAKQHILTKDSEQQMILTARRSLVQKMARHQQPQIEIFFLNINVRRDHLVEDSLKEISEKQKDLKKKLKISFVDEPGLDMGGLTKEWFQLLIKNIFEPDNGMFVYYSHSQCYWFSLSQKGNLREYNLIGVLMGLAVYNSIILDLHFPSVCYRKLLTPPVVPAIDTIPVGIVADPSLEDLAEIMPDVAMSLREILAYDGDVSEDLVISFQASVEEYGRMITQDLTPEGADQLVTNKNREEFVRLYLEWLLNSSIEERFRAFYLGFHSVCASNALIMLRPEEVEQLVCGSQVFDVNELRKVTFYDGYKAEDATVRYFWEVSLSCFIIGDNFLLAAIGYKNAVSWWRCKRPIKSVYRFYIDIPIPTKHFVVTSVFSRL